MGPGVFELPIQYANTGTRIPDCLYQFVAIGGRHRDNDATVAYIGLG